MIINNIISHIIINQHFLLIACVLELHSLCCLCISVLLRIENERLCVVSVKWSKKRKEEQRTKSVGVFGECVYSMDPRKAMCRMLELGIEPELIEVDSSAAPPRKLCCKGGYKIGAPRKFCIHLSTCCCTSFSLCVLLVLLLS